MFNVLQYEGPILSNDDEEMITNTWPALHSSAEPRPRAMEEGDHTKI